MKAACSLLSRPNEQRLHQASSPVLSCLPACPQWKQISRKFLYRLFLSAAVAAAVAFAAFAAADPADQSIDRAVGKKELFCALFSLDRSFSSLVSLASSFPFFSISIFPVEEHSVTNTISQYKYVLLGQTNTHTLLYCAFYLFVLLPNRTQLTLQRSSVYCCMLRRKKERQRERKKERKEDGEEKTHQWIDDRCTREGTMRHKVSK